MQIMGLGLDPEGELLFKPTEQAVFARQILAEWGNVPKGAGSGSFRGEVMPQAVVAGDPRAVGWTYLIHSADPWRDQILEIMKPLAERRGMEEPKAPLLFSGEAEDEWLDWIETHCNSKRLEGKTVPHYVLIVGAPRLIPFKFQSFLDTGASVGRLDFDSLDDLEAYVHKIIRLESAPEPVVSRQALLFATDQGLPDPTFYSHHYMAEPLKDHMENRLKVPTHFLAGADATRPNLSAALTALNPALVYSASHGLAAIRKPLDYQKRYNGGLCCQYEGRFTPEDLFSADDIPLDRPFLEGSVFFQFACFGYGTPATSDLSHWRFDYVEEYAGQEFVAALPRKLLAHPHGPLAYIGHLDIALLHGFADPKDPQGAGRWGARMSVFVGAVNKILGVQSSGLAMQDLNDRFNAANFAITNTYDRQRRGALQWSEQAETRLVDNWLMRTDAQNFMILGDPAARVRLPEA